MNLKPADAKAQTSLYGPGHEAEVTVRVCKHGKKKPPRKQNSPSDIKRRQTAKSRSNVAKAVRALQANGAFVPGAKKIPRSPKLKPAKGSVKNGRVQLDVYQVYRDQNGVAYLRVAVSEKGAQFIVNKGFHVEVISTDHKHARLSLYLQPVVGANIIECAKRLLRPLNDNVTISTVAKLELQKILENKELQMKSTANAKPTKFSTVTAPAAKNAKGKTAVKKSTSKKSDAGERKSRLENQIVTLKKMPKEDALPTQAFQICKVLKGKNGKTAVATLVGALEGVIETKQPLTSIWAFYRGRLIKEGYVVISEA